MDPSPLLSSGAETPTGSGRESPVHSGSVRRTSSWGGGLLSPATQASAGDGDGARKPGAAVRETRAR
jgi:hypothetical protein